MARHRAAAGQPPPPELEGPELPEIAAHVWQWFLELHARRGSNGFGPEQIGYALVDAWARWTGTRPGPLELEWILELDHIWLKHQQDQQDGKPATKGMTP